MPNEQTSVPLFASGEVLTAANMNLSAGTRERVGFVLRLSGFRVGVVLPEHLDGRARRLGLPVRG